MKQQSMQSRIKKNAWCAMLTALAMIFSYVESLIPINFGVPGMKLGLANLVTVTGLYLLSPVEVLVIVIMRILLTGFLFGNGMSILYSLAGGILSLLIMYLARKIKGLSEIGVSIIGGVFHNVGQIMVAVFAVQSFKIAYYLPFLSLSGAITGMLIGIVGKKIYRNLKKGQELYE